MGFKCYIGSWNRTLELRNKNFSAPHDRTHDSKSDWTRIRFSEQYVFCVCHYHRVASCNFQCRPRPSRSHRPPRHKCTPPDSSTATMHAVADRRRDGSPTTRRSSIDDLLSGELSSRSAADTRQTRRPPRAFEWFGPESTDLDCAGRSPISPTPIAPASHGFGVSSLPRAPTRRIF